MKPNEDCQSNESAGIRAAATGAAPGGGNAPATDAPEASPGFWSGRPWLFGALLLAITLLAYLPVWRAGFIWDDDTLLLRNPGIQTPGGLARLWSSDFPLATTTLWLEWRLWGADPLGYHLVNVLLHALSAVLLWRVLKRLNVPGAPLAAAIFAVHPANVESVAWISERKNLLCMFFYLLTLLLYLRFDHLAAQPISPRNTHHATRPFPSSLLPPPSALPYALSLLAFALALLSKTAVAPLPLVLLGLAWWQRGRLTLRDVWRTVPFFAVAAPAGLVSLWYQTHQAIGASMIDVRNDSFWARLAGAGWAVWFYLYKAIVPLNLSFVYPRWRIDAHSIWSYVPGVLVGVGLLVCWWRGRRWGKALLFGLGYFVLLLLPVLGFLNIYFMRYSLVADHWQYFAIIGPIALVAAGITRAFEGVQSLKSKVQSPERPSPGHSPHPMGRGGKVLYPVVCSILVVALGVLTWRQAGTYTNLETLWRATLARNPAAGLAHNNLGTLLLQRGRGEEAIAHFEKALAIEPNAADVHSNLGGALLGEGRVDQAVAQFREALRIQPDSALAHNNLGTALLRQGRVDEAVAHFQRAVALQPALASARSNLGGALLQAARVDAAIAELRRALELDPTLADAQMSLGNALLAQGQSSEAIAHLQQAVDLQPGLAGPHHNLASALLRAGRVDEAIDQFQKALAIRPDFASAHNGLGNALLQKGRVDDAIAHFQQALRLQPNLAEAHLNLANVLLQKDQLDPAIAHFQIALQIQPNLAPAHNNLANALLRQGRVDEAIAHFQQALRLEPNLAEAHNGLGNALLQKGRVAEAVEQYQAAVAARPGNPYLLNNLAWLLAACPDASVRNGARAVALAQQAERLSGGKDPMMLGTLAAAYAEAGQFPEAMAAGRRALELATAQGNTALADSLRTRLSLYQAGSPFRDPGLAPRGK